MKIYVIHNMNFYFQINLQLIFCNTRMILFLGKKNKKTIANKNTQSIIVQTYLYLKIKKDLLHLKINHTFYMMNTLYLIHKKMISFYSSQSMNHFTTSFLHTQKVKAAKNKHQQMEKRFPCIRCNSNLTLEPRRLYRFFSESNRSFK